MKEVHEKFIHHLRRFGFRIAFSMLVFAIIPLGKICLDCPSPMLMFAREHADHRMVHNKDQNCIAAMNDIVNIRETHKDDNACGASDASALSPAVAPFAHDSNNAVFGSPRAAVPNGTSVSISLAVTNGTSPPLSILLTGTTIKRE
jgi:hypothetical protein